MVTNSRANLKENAMQKEELNVVFRFITHCWADAEWPLNGLSKRNKRS
jgi:hypothetical protein